MELNRNNFLRWDGEFTPAPFSNVAVDDPRTMIINDPAYDVHPLINDTSTFGIDPNSVEITLQSNPLHPAVWDAINEKFTYFPPVGVTLGDKILKYRWKDVEGNPSNEATVTITVVPRPTAYRVYPPSFNCVLSGGDRTGYSQYDLLEEFYTDTFVTVTPLHTVPNVIGNPYYVAPVLDPLHCSTTGYNTFGLRGPYSTKTEACESIGSLINFYTNDDSPFLTPGVELFDNSSLTTPSSTGYYNDGSGMIYRIIDGLIIDQLTCG